MLSSIFQTILNAAIAVSALFILTRIIGRKQMSQLTFFDYIIGISIGSIAADFAIHTTINISDGLAALIVFTLFSICVSFVSVKSYAARKILDGTPQILIENGKIIEIGLKKTKLNINDLLEECRQKDIFDIADIEFAILEASGKLSILKKPQVLPLTPKIANIATDYMGLCANVVIDGKIIDKHLTAINLDKTWLHEELAKQQVATVADVLLAYVDSGGALVVHRKGVPGGGGGVM